MSSTFLNSAGQAVDRVFMTGSAGKTAEKVTAAGAESKTVKASPGTVYGIVTVSSGVTVTLKDGTTDRWVTSDTVSPGFVAPIDCGTSIILAFSGAGDAFIVYE